PCRDPRRDTGIAQRAGSHGQGKFRPKSHTSVPVQSLLRIPSPRRDELMMEQTNLTTDDGFERFQKLLLAMRAGEELRAEDVSHVTGLDEPTCRSVLEGLVRAGLMTHE